LKSYIGKVAFQEAPYTNSIEFVNELKAATPDSLQYVIHDMFETITLYDNRISEVKSKKLKNGTYQVDIAFEVSKYKANEDGKRSFKDKKGKTLTYTKKGDKFPIESYPLADYVEIGIFSDKTVKDKKTEKELYLKKVKVNKINNSVSIIVKEKPTEVGVDPYNKLIDTNSDDNRRKL
jgi:ABC-2 type transport system permease protein